MVAPGLSTPLCVHWNSNGPVPEGVVLKVPLSPVTRVISFGPVAVVGSFTVSVAQLVIFVQAPVTTTQ